MILKKTSKQKHHDHTVLYFSSLESTAGPLPALNPSLSAAITADTEKDEGKQVIRNHFLLALEFIMRVFSMPAC